MAWRDVAGVVRRRDMIPPDIDDALDIGDALADALVESERQKEEGDAEYRTLHNMLVGAERDHRRNYDNIKSRADLAEAARDAAERRCGEAVKLLTRLQRICSAQTNVMTAYRLGKQPKGYCLDVLTDREEAQNETAAFLSAAPPIARVEEGK